MVTRASQRWDPAEYARTARFVSDLGAEVLALLDPAPGERILDLGCGDGMLSERIARAGAEVVALDSSAEQVAAARARGVAATVGDAAALEFTGEFDAVFSNAALHWVTAADAAIAGIHRALRPGGRFVAEFGGAGNVQTIRAALVAALDRRGVDGRAADPWYFPGVEEYSTQLAAHGFSIDSIELFPRPTSLPGDVVDWLALFAQPFLGAVPDDARGVVLREVRDAVRPRLQQPDGTWTVDYVRLRVRATRAVKPSLDRPTVGA